MRGIVVGGTSSGVGKTVATLAVIHALEAAGKSVQPAKAGPDFIDPSHHEAVVDRPSRTLDTWLQGTDGVRRNYHRGEGDICVVEGMMGLYDGSCCSTAMVAEALEIPVVLVVDASGGMESVAATALGFREYATRIDTTVDVVGIIAQRVHGGVHEDGIREALPDELTYFGRIPPRETLEIPDRHLGLHMGAEAGLARADLAAVSEYLRVTELVDVATRPPEPARPKQEPGTGDGLRPRVAVAQDEAFCFFYPATIERLRESADVEPFSPVAGDELPPCDGIYLPGGYPELHADALATGETLDSLRERAVNGVPILGECGGMMALSESITTTDGETSEMAGVLPAAVEMHDRFQALDHVELSALKQSITAREQTTVRGHEFHYSSADVARDGQFVFEVQRGTGIDGDHDGLAEYRTLGTYAHVHPESGAFDRFLESLQ